MFGEHDSVSISHFRHLISLVLRLLQGLFITMRITSAVLKKLYVVSGIELGSKEEHCPLYNLSIPLIKWLMCIFLVIL